MQINKNTKKYAILQTTICRIKKNILPLHRIPMHNPVIVWGKLNGRLDIPRRDAKAEE